MKKYFVVSDVHSFYKPLREALENAGFDENNPNHIFVSCGDLLDRGPDTVKILEFMQFLPDYRKILIRGNHDYLMYHLLTHQREADMYDVSNGTMDSIAQLCGFPNIRHVWVHENISDESLIYRASINPLWEDYWSQTVNYAVVDKYIFVHGYGPYNTKDWSKLTDQDWYRWTWENGHRYALRNNFYKDKTIIFGHYHNSWPRFVMHNCSEFNDDANFETMFYDQAIGLDGCVAHTGLVNVFTFETE